MPSKAENCLRQQNGQYFQRLRRIYRTLLDIRTLDMRQWPELVLGVRSGMNAGKTVCLCSGVGPTSLSTIHTIRRYSIKYNNQ